MSHLDIHSIFSNLFVMEQAFSESSCTFLLILLQLIINCKIRSIYTIINFNLLVQLSDIQISLIMGWTCTTLLSRFSIDLLQSKASCTPILWHLTFCHRLYRGMHWQLRPLLLGLGGLQQCKWWIIVNRWQPFFIKLQNCDLFLIFLL